MRLAFTFIGVLAATALAAGLLVGGASATYPGTNNGRLAFAMNVGGNMEIYSVLPSGDDLRRLTDDPSFDACPSYSGSGKEIAFCSNRSGNFEIWKMKQNGTQEEQVTHLGGRVLFPDFSPDGSKLLFSGTVGGDPHSDLYTVDADGSGLVQLTSGAGNNSLGVWSPDGSKIAFISDRTGFDQVWVMDGNGANPEQLTTDPTAKGQLPDWSPDGSKIAYADSLTGTSDIYVMNADGSDQTRLTTSPDVEFGAAWSPDGTQIAYVRFVNGDPAQRTVFVMNADGSGQHAVHPGPGFQVVPGWQPRGERLAPFSLTAAATASTTAASSHRSASAASTAPAQFTVVDTVTGSGENGYTGTFTSSGLICPSGTWKDTESTGGINTEHACPDGSGVIDSILRTGVGVWYFTGGTGRYTTLRGGGNCRVSEGPPIVRTCQFLAAFDDVAPSATLTRLAVSPTSSMHRHTVHTSFTARDDVAGNAVHYKLIIRAGSKTLARRTGTTTGEAKSFALKLKAPRAARELTLALTLADPVGNTRTIRRTRRLPNRRL